jgi:hypothetical protein
MIKLTVGQLLEAMGTQEKSPLRKLAALDLPVRTSWEFSETILAAQEQTKRAQELQQKLFVKYGEQKEDKLIVPQANMEAFLKDVNEMTATEIELPGNLILKSLILKKETNELSGADLVALRPFINTEG